MDPDLVEKLQRKREGNNVSSLNFYEVQNNRVNHCRLFGVSLHLRGCSLITSR